MDQSRDDGGKEQPEQAGETLVVALDGSGTHQALAAAIADAGPGATIRVGPGTHRLKRAFTIRESVILVGAGMDLTEVVCDRGDFVLRYEGRGLFSLRDLSVRWEGPQGRAADVVSVHGGAEVLIEDCRFTGATSREQMAGAGLELKGSVRGSVLRCQANGNGWGIVVGEHAQPLLEGNTCRQNKIAGIAYFGDSAGIARRNSCLNTVESYGFYAIERSHPTLEENVCRDNTWTGIAYFDQAGGVARRNECIANGMSGFIVAQEARPELDSNICREHRYCGIIYAGTARGRAHHNLCADNGLFGIWLGEQSRPRLEHNTCERNPKAGVYVTAEAWPTLVDFPGWDLVRRPHR